MKRFIKRALEKLDIMSLDNIRTLIKDISTENELLEMVFESMTDGVVVTDKRHRILIHNKSSERLIPFVTGELIEKKLFDVIDDKEISNFIKEKLVLKESVFDTDFTLENGRSRIIACSIMPLVYSGSIQGSLIHIEDVTEKREKETRLRRAESLAALTTLTAGVAHEIKNPLASIGIHIQLMQKLMRNKDTIKTEQITNHLEILTEEVDRLNMIVVDFLFAVRPMDTKLQLTDINKIINDLIGFVKFELDELGIKIELELNQVPEIPIDDKLLKQALLNLIKNAQDAMRDGGRLIIRTKYKNDKVRLEISDTGSGMEEDVKMKIFEPYFTTKEFSSGLGLTLVFKIIKEHRGDISLKTRPGEGTTFCMDFPVQAGEKKLLEYEENNYEV